MHEYLCSPTIFTCHTTLGCSDQAATAFFTKSETLLLGEDAFQRRSFTGSNVKTLKAAWRLGVFRGIFFAHLGKMML